MIHKNWHKEKGKRRVRCITNNAKRYKVDTMLTVGKEYDVVNETEEFIFIIDNSNRVGGYFKEYFSVI